MTPDIAVFIALVCVWCLGFWGFLVLLFGRD